MAIPDPDAFDAILRRGRAALAWEVLRRDPAYREAYEQLKVSPSVSTAADPSFVADWGLHFR